MTRHPKLMELIALFKKRHPEVLAHVAPTVDGFIGYAGRRLLSPLTRTKLERVLGYLLDENEFLSPYGIRSLSRYHREHPFVFHVGGQEHRVEYLPAESNTGMFGGNSNWRGPIWMPVNALIVRGLLNLYGFYGDDFKVECPTGSGNRMTLFEVAKEISRRLSSIFLRDASGRRPVYGGTAKFQDDPHWRDLILFYEYFHGDNGAGLGASHQTGWTGLIARLLDLFGRVTAEDALETPKEKLEARLVRRAGGRRRTRRRRAMSTPRYPALFQVNTRVRLSELAAALGRPATLDDIPDAELDRLAADGFDLVWFLGVWQTGEAARRVSRSNPEWLAEYHRVLPDFREEDVCGSCFAVRDYRVHEDFGGDEALARLRARLKRRGPAPHPRLRPEPHGAGPPLGERAPGLLRVGDGGAARRAAPELLPRRQTGAGARVLAYGRDPYFDGWPDTLQLNYGNPALQEAMLGELRRIARQCDGVRCDMAMLVLPEVFERTWGISAAAVLARGRRRPSAPRSRASSSSPRSTGTSSGRSSSRASTTPTTSGSTTAWWRATPARSASTSSPASTSRTTWPASSRTTTSRGPRPRSRPRCTGPPPSSPSSRRACASSTRASARASGCASPSTSAAGRTRPPTPGSPRSTTASSSA